MNLKDRPLTNQLPSEKEITRDLLRFSGQHFATDVRSDLLEFTGRLTDFDVEDVLAFGRNETYVKLVFDQVKVLRQQDDTTAYTATETDLYVKHSSAAKSKWGFVWADIASALGVDAAGMDFMDAVGQNWHFNTVRYDWGVPRNPGNMQLGQDGHLYGDVWEVKTAQTVSVSAPAQAPAPTPAAAQAPLPNLEANTSEPNDEAHQAFLRIMDGKSQYEAYGILAGEMPTNQGLMHYLSNTEVELLKAVEAGSLTKDDEGVYHKAG